MSQEEVEVWKWGRIDRVRGRVRGGTGSERGVDSGFTRLRDSETRATWEWGESE